ncbi:hypothetical protein JCM10450v2_005234 [Rhodotorula kratochvilovae]
MTHYDSFPFDPAAWTFPQQQSPPLQPAHPADALDPSASVFGASSAAPWALDSSVPPSWSTAAHAQPASGAQPGGSSSTSFLSPLPLPNLSLGPPPAGDPSSSSAAAPLAIPKPDPDAPDSAALQALMNASPLLGAQAQVGASPSADLPGEGGAVGASGVPGVGGGAVGEDGDGAASFVNMPAATYAHLIQQARSSLFGSASSHSSPGALEAVAGTSASLAPASTYISAPPSGASTPVPPATANSGDQAGLSGSLAAAAAQYGLPLALHQHQHAHAHTHFTHQFAPPLSLHLNPPSGTASPALSQHTFAPPPQFAPPASTSGAHPGEGHDRPLSDTDSDSASGSGSESDSGDDEPVAFAAHAHLQGVVQDHFTPATSAHHSDHEKAPSPPGGPLLYGIAPPHAGGSAASTPAAYYHGGAAPGEAYDPGAPYIPFLRPSSLSSASSRSLSAGTRAPAPAPPVNYRQDEPPELPYASDDSADGDFGRRPKPAASSAAGGERARGRTRTRKPSAAALAAAQAGQAVAGLANPLGFAAPRPGPTRSTSAASGGSSAQAGPSGSGGGGGRKRPSPGADAVPAAVSGPGAAVDPVTGYPRRQTEIPAVEDDPSIRPYGCNWCRLDGAAAAGGTSAKGKARAHHAEEDEGDEGETSWRTIKELREHAQRSHKERAARAKQDDDEAVMMEMPFCCALDPCGKTFKSLAGLRFHFQNASANGHFFVQLERDAATGEERATKKFKQEVKPSGRELKCPVGRCPKRFKQSAGLAYHLSHTPNHPITEAMLATFEPTLQSKTRWWFGRLNKQFEKA